MKTCNYCQVSKPLTEFYNKPSAKDGLFWWCRTCHREKAKARYHALAKDVGYKLAEKHRLAALRCANPEVYRQYAKVYAQKNKAQVSARTQRYVSSRSNRTPKWLTEDDFWMMEQAYELAALRTAMFGFSWHVDHVLPLRGSLVSGLHVPHNLQVIPASDNLRKSNRFIVT